MAKGSMQWAVWTVSGDANGNKTVALQALFRGKDEAVVWREGLQDELSGTSVAVHLSACDEWDEVLDEIILGGNYNRQEG